MEGRKDEQLPKKVRFDLNEEVFLIPSKWDRLSKCKTTNARIIDRMMASKSRTIVDRRIDIKGKQNRNRKKQNVFAAGKLDSNPEPSRRFSANNRPNFTPSIKSNNARKNVRHKEGTYENTNSGNRDSTSSVEGRLKLYHRPSRELPKLDLVLPKIPCTPDLKKAIEKALLRSRSRPYTLDSGPLATQEKSPELLTSHPRDKTEKMFQRRLSDSSIRIGDEKPMEKKQKQIGEASSKFSDLSCYIDDWNPFSAWSSKESNNFRSNSTAPLTRGRSMSSLIPSSILY